MTLGVLVLATLVLWACLVRRERLHGAIAPARFQPAASSRREWLVAWAVVILAHAPYLRDVSSYVGPRALMWVDQFSHAAVAQSIARGALAHGWIETYDGGFPLGPHYPSLGWLIMAAMVRVGLPAAQAVKTLGVVSTLAVPVVVLLYARRLGASAAAAALGAIALSTITPYTSFAGGWGAFSTLGLVSQVLAVPIAIAWVLSLVDARSRARAPLYAALAVAAHPQIFIACAVVVSALALVAFDARARANVVRSFVAAGALGIALYAPGVATLHTPFGWPPMDAWKTVGFGAERLAAWLGEGDLLDFERPPVVTYAWIVATLVVLARSRSRACRGALLASLVSIALAVSGRAYEHLGPAGTFIATFVQPMRALAIVPMAAAATIAIAVHEIRAIAISLASEGSSLGARAQRAAHATPWLALIAFAATVFPSNARYAATLRAVQNDEWAGACERRVPGFDAKTIAGWVARLERGRVAFDTGGGLEHCPAVHGVELASAVPLSDSLGAGAHVGVSSSAFQSLRPTAPGGAARAEALGVRTVVHRGSQKLAPADQWRTVATRGEIEMSERTGGTDVVGVGCVEHRWSGSDSAIRAALFADLAGGAHVIEDPRALTELSLSSGPLVIEDVPHTDCDASSAEVRERRREPGAYEATVSTARDVDVVFRANAFPTWRVRVDDASAPTKLVAPGWFVVRVGPGSHHVTAEVSPLRFYLGGIVLALAVVVLVSARVLERAKDALARRAALPAAPSTRV